MWVLLHIKMERENEVISDVYNDYKTLKHRINTTYPIKVRELEQYAKNIFKDVNESIAKIELLVKEEFGKAIEKIDLREAKILDYRVEYNKESKNFEIEITKLLLPRKGHTLEKIFASIYDNRLSPEIRELREKYDICSIKCNIKGIEYAEEKK
jgi:hypothetical protein